MTRLLSKLTLAAAALLCAAPALAQTGAASVAIRYSDLRLDDPAAAGILERRIERAAADVCGGQPDLRDLDRRPSFDACRAEAANRAVSQLLVAGVFRPAHDAGMPPLASR